MADTGLSAYDLGGCARGEPHCSNGLIGSRMSLSILFMGCGCAASNGAGFNRGEVEHLVGLAQRLAAGFPVGVRFPAAHAKYAHKEEVRSMKSKEQKRMEAVTRQAEYDALTPAEKWKRLESRPGMCAREKNRPYIK